MRTCKQGCCWSIILNHVHAQRTTAITEDVLTTWACFMTQGCDNLCAVSFDKCTRLHYFVAQCSPSCGCKVLRTVPNSNCASKDMRAFNPVKYATGTALYRSPPVVLNARINHQNVLSIFGSMQVHNHKHAVISKKRLNSTGLSILCGNDSQQRAKMSSPVSTQALK